MGGYWNLTVLLNFLVDLLLMMGANRLAGHPIHGGKCALAAVIGGLHAGMCLVPGFGFLGNMLWRLVVLAIMSVFAFGASMSGLRRGALFALLSMALCGMVVGIGTGGIWGLLGSAAGLCLLCLIGFRDKAGGQHFVPVELAYGKRSVRLTALRDTGNTLRDPVTGRSVLIVASGPAQELTGLSKQQLQDPVRTMGAIPGLRLIPYRTIGQTGLLLALHIPAVRIGSWRGSGLVAFAPERLCADGTYEALTGGMI